MITYDDLQNPPSAGLNHIDALLGNGPQWNFRTSGGSTINYTFSTTAGIETFNKDNPAGFSGALTRFTNPQQVAVREALNYISQVTGIVFVETADGNAADLHFASANLTSANTTGLCSWGSPIRYDDTTREVSVYTPDAYVYLDNVEFAAQNALPTKGSPGYETLLHELGHALGLKHPFQERLQLPESEDNTLYTLMSYTDIGGPYGEFRPYDLAALNFLYGGDGLGGALGKGAAGTFLTGSQHIEILTGTAYDDKLQGMGGNDTLNGGAGIDIALYEGKRGSHTVAKSGAGFTVRDGAGAIDTLLGVERLQFGDAAMALDIDGNGGQAYRLYAAAFDRKPDVEGLGFWIEARDNGVSLETIAGDFIKSTEFVMRNGTDLANQQFLTVLYQNVLHRAPDGDGYAFWLDALDRNLASRASVLAQFSESPENQAQVIGQIQNGFEYIVHG